MAKAKTDVTTKSSRRGRPQKTAAGAVSQESRPRGRPRLEDAKRMPLQVRADAEERARWRSAAETTHQPESQWVREALDMWSDVTARASRAGVDAPSLVRDALENHAKARAAVAELQAAKVLSESEQRVLRILAPSEWAERYQA